MIFLAVSTKTVLTVGAILGATAAIVKNKDEVLDIVVECLQNCANGLNKLKSEKHKVQSHQSQEGFNSVEDDDHSWEQEKAMKGREYNERESSGDFHRAYCQSGSESELTTPESSDWELLSDGRESPADLSRSHSYDTLQIASID